MPTARAESWSSAWRTAHGPSPAFPKRKSFRKWTRLPTPFSIAANQRSPRTSRCRKSTGRQLSLLKSSPVCSVPTISRARASWKAPTSAWPEQPAMRSGIVCRNSSWKGQTAPLTRWSGNRLFLRKRLRPSARRCTSTPSSWPKQIRHGSRFRK